MSKSYQIQFVEACADNNLNLVRDLWENHKDEISINASLKRGDTMVIRAKLRTAFTASCVNGVLSVGLFLMEQLGFDINARDEFGDTPFIAACKHISAKYLEVIMRKFDDIDFNVVDCFSNNCLHILCNKMNYEGVELLSKLPPTMLDFNVVGENGDTALDMVLEFDDLKNKSNIDKIIISLIANSNVTIFTGNNDDYVFELFRKLLLRENCDLVIIFMNRYIDAKYSSIFAPNVISLYEETFLYYSRIFRESKKIIEVIISPPRLGF